MQKSVESPAVNCQHHWFEYSKQNLTNGKLTVDRENFHSRRPQNYEEEGRLQRPQGNKASFFR